MARKPLLLRFNDRLKRSLKTSALGGILYKNVLQPVWKAWRKPHIRRLMDAHGYEMLARMHSVFQKYEIPYYCDGGTLLGFVRDGGFIKGDADLDVSVVPDYDALAKVLKAFLDEGYRYIHAFEFQGRLLEFTVMDPKVELTMDVFMSEYCGEDKSTLLVRYLRWFKDRKYPSDRENTVMEFKFPAPTGIKEIVVHGVTVCIPENAEEILDAEYGPWRTPDPSFNSESIPHEESKFFARRIDECEALAFVERQNAAIEQFNGGGV